MPRSIGANNILGPAVSVGIVIVATSVSGRKKIMPGSSCVGLVIVKFWNGGNNNELLCKSRQALARLL